MREDVGLERRRPKGAPALVVAPPNTNTLDDLHRPQRTRRSVRPPILEQTPDVSVPEKSDDQRYCCDKASEDESAPDEPRQLRSELASPEISLDPPRRAGDRARKKYESAAPGDRNHHSDCKEEKTHVPDRIE